MHEWNVTPDEAVAIQEQWRTRVIADDTLDPAAIQTVASRAPFIPGVGMMFDESTGWFEVVYPGRLFLRSRVWFESAHPLGT